MARINFDNAKERINAILCGFPKTDNGECYIVTEKQFDEIVERINSESTKAFAEAIAKQTKKTPCSWHDARISTYKCDFGFFKFC